MRTPFRRLLVALLPVAAGAYASDFVVTRYDDPVPGTCLPADCSLREAALAAEASPEPDRILLSAGTYSLTLGDPSGGKVVFRGTTELVGPGATMTFVDSEGLGETPLFSDGDSFVARGITFQNSDDAGLVLSATLNLVESCEVRGSVETGIYVLPGAFLSLRYSTIQGNGQDGVHIYDNAQGDIENSTMTGNAAQDLFVQIDGYVNCTHCTIVGPADPVNVTIGGVADFANSIVAGACSISSGAIFSRGGNIEAAGDSCALDDVEDQTGVPSGILLLSSFGDHGGATRTFVPSISSPATGGGNDAECLFQVPDQRGVDRTSNNCESGSVERSTSRVLTPIFHDGFLQGDAEAWSNP